MVALPYIVTMFRLPQSYLSTLVTKTQLQIYQYVIIMT